MSFMSKLFLKSEPMKTYVMKNNKRYLFYRNNQDNKIMKNDIGTLQTGGKFYVLSKKMS